MKKLFQTYKDLIGAIAITASVVSVALAADARYAKKSIETTIVEIKVIVCATAIKNKVKDADKICEGMFRR